MELRVTCTCGEVKVCMGFLQGRLTGDLQGLHQQLGEQVLAFVRMGFEREQTPEGTPWTPLAVATVKRRKGSAHPILRVQGDLYRSVTVQASHEKATIGTNWRYARIHQLGGKAGRGHKVTIPARPYLYSPGGGIPPRWQAALERIITRHLEPDYA